MSVNVGYIPRLRSEQFMTDAIVIYLHRQLDHFRPDGLFIDCQL